MSWQKEVIAYQIYPRSFKDSNGDGIGDLRGIIEKLDYLKDLGINLIWISPIYKSPNDDNGYDISDYQEIMSEFGTMEDFDELLKEAHKRYIKVIMDLVVNHTSDQHPWFLEAKSSKDSDKRDWYIWKDGKDGKEPNNWESIFGGSAWKYDEKTDQYFLHLFSDKMPDLNWENEELRSKVYEMINWWFEKGIDGFRVDAISHIKKCDYEDMDNPEELAYVPSFEKHMKQPGICELLDDINKNTFAKHDCFTIAEASGLTVDDLSDWTGKENGKFSMAFQFEHNGLWKMDGKEEVDLVQFKKILTKWQKQMAKDGWAALFLENHDVIRSTSKLGDTEVYWKESAKALALMYFMQMGTPFIYQGQELGMTNVDFTDINDFDDRPTIFNYNERIKAGMPKEESLKIAKDTSRDNSRSPMQWNSNLNAGFTTGTPWLKVNGNYKYINAEEQIKDKDSVLNFYKKMIVLRREFKTLVYGEYKLLLEDDPYIYAYTREGNNEKFLIVTNISKNTVELNLNLKLTEENILIKNYEEIKNHSILRPYEARMYKLR